jgi:outer membrane protein OmpA-like peptidoglycan-associated protein
MIPKLKTLSVMAALILTSVCAFAAGDTEIKGMIMARTGETLIVNSGGQNVTVVLTDNTVTKDDRGLFGLDKEHLSSVVLIPGLKVKIKGTSDDQGRVVARTITTDGDDLETAEMIQAGLHPTAEQVAANVQAIEGNRHGVASNKQAIDALAASHQQGIDSNKDAIAAHQQQIAANIADIDENTKRFAALSDYDVKGEATVNFSIGSSKLSAADQEKILNLAQTAAGLTGYIVEVIGYADATGSAEINTRLSEARAKAVITQLVQQGNVPVRHIVAPGAMGEYGPAAPNETKAGRAENRRVEIKVLVNKGIAGS